MFVKGFERAVRLLLLILCLPLGGCGLLRSIGLLPSPPPPVALPEAAAPPPPEDYLLGLTLTVATDVNPDPSGRASPLRVHVYVDERDPRLAELGFDAVFGAGPGGAASATGDVSEPLETLVVTPGQRVELALTPSSESTWISVAAAYREPWSAIWVDTQHLDDTIGTATARVTLDAAAVRIFPDGDS